MFHVCSLLLVLLAAATAATGEEVERLSELTLPRVTDEAQGPVLILFHVTWCPHCRHSLPLFEAMTVPFLRRATLDCTSRNELCKHELGVSAWPTVLLVYGEKAWAFSGAANRVNDLSAWASRVLPDVMAGREVDGARAFHVPSTTALLRHRLEIEWRTTAADVAFMWERHRATVVVLALVGFVVGYVVASFCSCGAAKAKRKRD